MSYRAGSFNRAKTYGVEKLYTPLNPLNTINALSDVNIIDPQDTDLLYYVESAGQWNNTTNPLTKTFVKIGSNAGLVNQGPNTLAIGHNAGVSNQGDSSTSIGSFAGSINQGDYATAIGFGAGISNQSFDSIAVGYYAGSNVQGDYSVAVGYYAASVNQGAEAISIGSRAGFLSQADYAIAIGYHAGSNCQADNSITIGYEAGLISAGINSVAIGYQAGRENLGEYGIAIGNLASIDGNDYSNCIVINASNGQLNPSSSNGTYINPIRVDNGSLDPTVVTPLYYDQVSKEIITSKNNRGALKIVSLSGDPTTITAVNCYGDMIYYSTNAGTLNLPPALEGMNVYITTPTGNTATLDAYNTETIDGALTYTLGASGNPRTVFLICPSDGIWFTNTTIPV